MRRWLRGIHVLGRKFESMRSDDKRDIVRYVGKNRMKKFKVIVHDA